MKNYNHSFGAPNRQQRLLYKLGVGLIMVAASLALAKLWRVWGQDYLSQAQNNFYDSMWLNEQRRTA